MRQKQEVAGRDCSGGMRSGRAGAVRRQGESGRISDKLSAGRAGTLNGRQEKAVPDWRDCRFFAVRRRTQRGHRAAISDISMFLVFFFFFDLKPAGSPRLKS